MSLNESNGARDRNRIGTRSTTSLYSVAQGTLFWDRDFKLRRFAGVSAAGARSRNPEAQRGISAWCPGPESNRYVPFGTRDFKSRASASFATRAGFAFKSLLYTLSACRFDCEEICGECAPIFGKFLAGAFLSEDRILDDLRGGIHIALAHCD
jgi:hypothetical protein